MRALGSQYAPAMATRPGPHRTARGIVWRCQVGRDAEDVEEVGVFEGVDAFLQLFALVWREVVFLRQRETRGRSEFVLRVIHGFFRRR